MACQSWCTAYTNDPFDPANTRTDPDIVLVTWSIDVANFSQWFCNEVLSIFDRSSTPEIPAQFYVAAHSSTSSAAAAGTEITDGNYARQAVSFERVNDIQRRSTAAVNFPAAAAGYTVASFSIWNAATGGDYYGFGNLASTLTVDAGERIEMEAGNIMINLT